MCGRGRVRESPKGRRSPVHEGCTPNLTEKLFEFFTYFGSTTTTTFEADV